MNPFTFAVFRLTIEAIDTLYLPEYKGSAIRGGFGHTFRRIVCVFKGKDCKECTLSNRCVYSYIFETVPAEKNDLLKTNDKQAHPYIIRPPMNGKMEYVPGEELLFELILIGKAIDYLPYFALTFIEMGKVGIGKGRGKFFLKRIDNIGLNAEEKNLYVSENNNLKSDIKIINFQELLEGITPSEQCTLRFLTRLELKRFKKYPEVNFYIYFNRLIDRIITLAFLHCGIQINADDFVFLKKKAKEISTTSNNLYWENAERYSNKQKKRMPFSGWKGDITFRGNLSPFWPFILLGEWVHVGKKTAFGFGRYELIKG
jgi:CRISPR-associated endoribonuclease Cas6